MAVIPPQMLIHAYSRGVFPMADSRHGQVQWYTADPRAILPLDAMHVPRSLRRRLRRGTYQLTRDQAFEQVIRGCAEPRVDENDTWINDEIIAAFITMHQAGFAHSVEAWDAKNQLVGGIYGLALGGAFFGESMFHRRTDASKCCLVHLADHLKAQGFVLFDVQISNPHLERFGVIEISDAEYQNRLRAALDVTATF